MHPDRLYVRTYVRWGAWLVALAALATLTLVLLSSAADRPGSGPAATDDDAPGSALPVSVRPAPDAIEASFDARSYRPGQVAHLIVSTRVERCELRIFRAGGGADGPLQGSPVTPATVLAGRAADVRVGAWPSGLYYGRLTEPGGRVGYATFVVAPRRLGEHRVAVVLPTNTWQAYNFFDGNGDGRPDSWYANPSSSTVSLDRPFLDAGVPPHYAGYDRGFLRWLQLERRMPDFLTDDDLERIASGDVLAKAYDLIVFSGHEEYVTTHEYDLVQRYRDLGGNLAFLSANDFFYRVERRSGTITRDGRWRDLGRPESALIGAQYVDWYQERYRNEPYLVTNSAGASWLFRGTGLADGTRFGNYGIEIDARTPASPRGTRVLARIANIFGPGKTAEMTYYTTPRGAKVFAAGVINFGGTSLWPGVREMVGNIWTELSRP
jgi:hypothetical protein